MREFLKKLFQNEPKADYKTLLAEGAIVLDVRSKGEFLSGHIPGAMNIPVDVLGNQLNAIPKGKTVITCCASGNRSQVAKNLLESNGYKQVFNGGGWNSLQHKIR
jgi:phage shock protein E